MTPIHVTLYAGANATQPLRADDFNTFGEFVEALAGVLNEPRGPDKPFADWTKEDRKAAKKEMLAWAPHRLRPGRTRCTTDIETVSRLVVIDVDGWTLDGTLGRIAEHQWTAALYTSASDDPSAGDEQRRFRVIVEASRDITVAECYRTRFALASLLGIPPGRGVEGAKEAAKLFFAGRYRGTPERELIEFEKGKIK